MGAVVVVGQVGIVLEQFRTSTLAAPTLIAAAIAQMPDHLR